MTCEYCGKARAVHKDHVVPKARLATLIREHALGVRKLDPLKNAPEWLFDTVPSCFACNMRKGPRLLVPPSWVKRISRLNRIGMGTFQAWDGGRVPEVIR